MRPIFSSDPPGPPLVSGPGNRVVSEGELVQERCEVRGGNPAPELAWYRDNVKLQFPSQRSVEIILGQSFHKYISIIVCEADLYILMLYVRTSVYLC